MHEGPPTECSDPATLGSDTHSEGGSSFISDEEEEVEVPIVANLHPVLPSVASRPSGFAQIDRWNVQEVFTCRASEMRTIPRFLWGSFRVALKVAMAEVSSGQSSRDVLRQERGWKMLLLLPRLLLHRSPRGGPISRAKFFGRFDQFAAGQWDELLNASQTCAQEAATAFTRRKRRTTNDETRRAARTLQFAQWCELSAGRQALEGAELARGNKRTLDQLRCRPDVPREAIPVLARGSPMFDLDERTFNRNVRSARKGAAGGPSGMTCDHLRPLLDSPRDLHALFLIADMFSRGQIPPSWAG